MGNSDVGAFGMLLVFAVMLPIAGLLMLTFKPSSKPEVTAENPARKSARDLVRKLLGVACLGFGLLSGVLYAFSPSLVEVRAIQQQALHTPADQVTSIRLRPARYSSLVSAPITVTDSAKIAEICHALERSERFSPNHPSAEWKVLLELTTNTGTTTMEISSTTSEQNGTYIALSTGVDSGYQVGSFRNDELRPILESIASP